MESSPPETAVSAAASLRKRWTIGTLTYTTAGLVILFSWLLIGDFSWQMKERSVQYVVQLLIRKYGASDTFAGILIGSLPMALVVLLNPIVSYRSDRHRGRWGRRIPFLIIPTPIAALSLAGLAFSPEIGTALHRLLGGYSPGLNQSVLSVFTLFWTIFEAATITANAVFFALINDVVPKAVLGRFYGMFRAVGLGCAMLFNYWLLGKAETNYTTIFIGISLLYGVGFTLMCFRVKEGQYPPPPSVPAQAGGFFTAAKTYFRECFTRPYLLWIYASIALSWTALSTINLFHIFFAQSVGMSMDTYGKYMAATFLISFTLSFFLGALADKFHPLRVGLVIMALYTVVILLGGLVIRDARTFGIALITYGVISGSWQTATASLTLRLFPQSRFAQLDSARALVTNFGMMLIGPVMGPLLDHSGHKYQYTYIASAILAALALFTGLIVHRMFMRMGGPKNYVAPE